MSLAGRVRRLRRVTRAEVIWRMRTLAHRTAHRCAMTVRTPVWRRELLTRVLAPTEVDDLSALLAAGRFEDAHHAIATHVRQRPVRSLLHPSLREPLRARVLAAYPAGPDDARMRGDRIVNGDYDLLGYEGLRFDGAHGAIDWHLDPVSGRRARAAFWADVPYLDPACGDHKVIWELNRHQHWVTLGRASWLTGDQRYRTRFIAEAASWMAANPPRVGANWASALELGVRAISWMWAIELFAAGDVPGEPPWLVDLLLGLDVQLRQVERNLSWYFSPNTHLLGEALALYVAGRTWPEFTRAAEWARIGGDILVGEIDRQVLGDGFHVERSTHYHRYALDFYLLALATARLTSDTGREEALAGVAHRMASALRCVTDAAGRVPIIGDDDGGELFPIAGHAPDDVRPTLAWAASLLRRPEIAMAPAPEAALWLTAALDGEASLPSAARPVMPDLSTVLGSSGYHVSRRNESLLVFDAGAHGFMNAGHAHADSLAVTLSAGEHRLLVDPGTGTYTMDPVLRDRLRSSESHNTVTVDGRSQSVPAGPFHWARTAQGGVERVVVGATFDLFHAHTDAYAPLRHERMVFATGAHTWVVADRLSGPGRHRACVHWHLDPAWTVAADGRGGWALTHRTGIEARLAIPEVTVDLLQGDADWALGWVAPIYGRLTPAPTLRGTSERSTPIWIVTTIDVGSPQVRGAVTTLLDVLSGDRGGSGCAVLTRRERHADVTFFRTKRERDTVSIVVEPRGTTAITTDAAALHARISNAGRLERVCLVDVTVFRFDGTAPVTITSPKPIRDADVSLDRGGDPVVATTGTGAELSISLDRPSTRVTAAEATVVDRAVLQQ
jgi:hypothetical protein